MTDLESRRRRDGDVECRAGCGACCIAPSISSLQKPAGQACRHLTHELRCSIFARPDRPQCCIGLRPSIEMCGATREEALAYLATLEALTAPLPHPPPPRR